MTQAFLHPVKFENHNLLLSYLSCIWPQNEKLTNDQVFIFCTFRFVSKFSVPLYISEQTNVMKMDENEMRNAVNEDFQRLTLT